MVMMIFVEAGANVNLKKLPASQPLPRKEMVQLLQWDSVPHRQGEAALQQIVERPNEKFNFHRWAYRFNHCINGN